PAVPPRNVQQRISRPLARLESEDSAIHREHLRSGLGAVLDLTALTPFIRRQQWFSRADLPEGTVISTSAVSGMEESLGNLAESAHRHVQSRLNFQAAIHNHMESAQWARESAELRTATQEIVDTVSPLEIPSMAQRRMERYGITIGNALSFRAKTAESAEANRLGVQDSAWRLSDRDVSTRFAENLDLPCSNAKAHLQRISEIDETYPCVIKSTRSSGARGCYLVFDHDRIIHTQDGTQLSSWSEMVAHAGGLMDPNSPISTLHDEWIVEELVVNNGRPAHEVKFFTFYGEVPLALEVKRDDELVYRFFDPNDNAQIAGSAPEWFDSPGVSGEELDLIKRISLSIPCPFVRVNTLRSDDGLIIDEFSPRAVGYDEVDDVWDQKLGESWVKAERRLLDDLLEGKEFSTFGDSLKPAELTPSSEKGAGIDSTSAHSRDNEPSAGPESLLPQAPPTFSDIRE